MSLIFTYINKFGVIIASDSNLSTNAGNAGFGQKVFSIQYLNAGLSYSGSYKIDGLPADEWLTQFITGAVFLHSTIGDFVNALSERLTAQMRDDEFSAGTIIHIAGYHKVENESYLEHWHISNMRLQGDGYYTKPENNFHHSNDFNSRTNEEHRKILIALDRSSTDHQFYINGFPPGRISAVHLKFTIDQALNQIWDTPGWNFRKPTNQFESNTIVKLYFHLIAELFKISDHNALYIGGDTQTLLIPTPQDLNKRNWA
ncbi:MAG: hypothetical protein U0T79_05255 [Ferruginibacter sp.]